MTTLLFLFLMLLPSAAGAEPLIPKSCHNPAPNVLECEMPDILPYRCIDDLGFEHPACYYKYSNCVNGACAITMHPLSDPCLATMEKAMRAMSPYLNHFDRDTGITHRSIFKGAPNAVMKLWKEAELCWKERP